MIKNKIEPEECGAVYPHKGHSYYDYLKIGLSPCGQYVAHWIERSCEDFEDIVDNSASDEPHECWCATGICPCGSFISHKISDPCPSKK